LPIRLCSSAGSSAAGVVTRGIRVASQPPVPRKREVPPARAASSPTEVI
jgi:hypothetical protein